MAQGATLPGETAFKLYDTFGFPYDLTEDALRARGLGGRPRRLRRGDGRAEGAPRAPPGRARATRRSDEFWFDIAEENGATEFTAIRRDEGEGEVVALVKDGERVDRADAGDEVDRLLNQTPFYGESGGQVGDAGRSRQRQGLRRPTLTTRRSRSAGSTRIAPRSRAGELAVGDTRPPDGRCRAPRRDPRQPFGDAPAPRGAAPAARRRMSRRRAAWSRPTGCASTSRTRRALTAEDIAAVEAEVNAEIRQNEPVTTRLMTPDDAIAAGAMALFGEKYGDEVRVLSMGRDGDGQIYSVELCGGTHVSATGDIGLFKIVCESAVSSGVRRIEALTGEAARHMAGRPRREAARGAPRALKTVARRGARRASPRWSRSAAGSSASWPRRRRRWRWAAAAAADAGRPRAGRRACKFLGQVVDGLDPKGLRGAVDDDEAADRLGRRGDRRGQRRPRVSVAVGVTDDLTAQLSAVDLVKAAVAALGGQGGGGRPDMAQGGGPDGDKAARCASRSVRASLGGAKLAGFAARRPSRGSRSMLRLVLDLLAQARRAFRGSRRSPGPSPRRDRPAPLRTIAASFERLGHRVGDPRLVELGGMGGVARAGDDRQVGHSRARAAVSRTVSTGSSIVRTSALARPS